MNLKDRAGLGVLAKIGQGGQGVVYRAPGVRTKFSASLVYKEYKPGQRDHVNFEALANMPALVEDSLSYADGERLISIAAWPCELVQDQGTPSGFVMPEIPEQFFISLTTMKGTSRNRAEFQHLLNHESVLSARGIVIDDVQRYRLLRELASALSFLHSHSVCVGDISPNNLLFSLKAGESVYFIDCDSMSINGISALTQVETPGWEIPAGEALTTIYSDSYKLGLLALRLLAGDQETRNVNDLPDHTPNMVRRIITDALRTEPQKRPLPEVWTYQLGYAIEEAQDHKTSHTATAPPPLPPVSPPVPPPRPLTAAPTVPATSSRGPSNWAYALGTAAAVATILLAVVGIPALMSSSSQSESSSSSPSTSEGSETPSTSTETSSTTSTTEARSLHWGTPPDTLPGPDMSGNTACMGGFSLTSDVKVSPAIPAKPPSYTSCDFAIAVGRAYLDSNPNYVSSSAISARSPRARCQDVATFPTVQCDGDLFRMDCSKEGPDDAMWIVCRGGNDAVVYIY